MTKDTRLWFVLLLNVSMVLALVIVGLNSHSLGVLAAGGDYLGDAAGVALVLIALRQSRYGTECPRSYPAVANATFLLVVTIVVIIEALRRSFIKRFEGFGLESVGGVVEDWGSWRCRPGSRSMTSFGLRWSP